MAERGVMAESGAECLTVTLELIRVEQADDPAAFRTGVQEYMLRGDEGTYATASLTWDEALLHWLAEIRRPGCDPEVVQAIGERLRRFLAAARFAAVEERIVRALAEQRRVRVEIVAGAAELAALPWELLTLGNRHLGELPGVEVQYRWPGSQATPSARASARAGGRVLVAWSRGGDPLGEQPTIDAIESAMRAGWFAFDRARDVIADASLPAIVAAIEAGIAAGDPPAVLHLLCHGAPVGSGYGLRLDDGRGGVTVVDGRTLRGALAPLAAYVRLVVLMACDSGNPGVVGTRLGSVASELHRSGFAAVVASRFPVTGAGALAFTEHLYETMLAGSCSVEQAFRGARERLVRRGSGDWSTFQLYAHGGPVGGTRPLVIRPYRGLLAFEREHAALCFGREPELAETLHDLDALLAGARPRLLAVVGASGTGKSSLVLAPVRVALEDRGWHVAVMRPGAAPNEALAEALRSRPADRTGVLVVDQFEELFTHTLDRGRADEAAAFVHALWRLAATSAVIVTLRVDYLGRCGELPVDTTGARLDRVVYDEAHRVFVAQMTPEALRTVVERPALRVGLRLEAGLVERLVGEVASESNALPLLEYVLDALWQRRVDDRLTHADLDAVGGVAGALEKHADAAVDALDEAAREQARGILVRLVVFGADAASGTRRREDERLLRSRRAPEASDRAVHALIAARLLVRREEAGGAASLEIAHEALIRRWGRLWRWYEDERDRLGRRRELDALTEQWRRYGPLSGKALALGQQLARGLGEDDIDPDVRTMLAVSEARARRQVRTRRALIGAALATLGVFAVVVGALYLQADRSARRSQASQRVAAAGRFITSRPHLAAALLRSVDEPGVPGWRTAAFSVLQAPLPTMVEDPLGLEPGGVAFTPGGLVVGGPDGSLRVFPPHGPAAPPIAGERRISDVAASRDGASILVLRPPQLELWDRASMTRRSAVDVDPEARWIHVGGDTGGVLVEAALGLSLWAPLGERLEARGQLPRALAIDARRELLVHADGDDAVIVETWSKRQVSRRQSPGIGRASRAIGGLHVDHGDGRVTAWPLGDGAELPPRTLAIPYLEGGLGLRAIATLADRTVFQAEREAFGLQSTPLCTQPVQAGAMQCIELPLHCTLGDARDRLVRVDCSDHVELRRVETLALAATLAGPDSTSAAVFGDDDGQVALFAVDRRQVWRWQVRPPPSGLVMIDRGWSKVAPVGYLRVPTLQGERDRMLAVLWESGRIRIEVWALRPGAIDQEPTSVTLDVPILDGDEYPGEQVFGGDAVLVHIQHNDGRPRLIVGAVAAGGITARSVGLAAGDVRIDAIAGDGRSAYGFRDAAPVRFDLGGDVAREAPIAGAPPAPDSLVLGPDGRYLATRGEALTVIDLAAGTALRPDAALELSQIQTVAFAPDGATLALGSKTGAITLTRATTDGALQHLTTLRGHRGQIEALAFSADGRALVSGDGARQVILWTELESPQPGSFAVEVQEPLWHVGLSAGGEQVWALSQLGELRFWSAYADEAALRRELAARARYCLSAREWTGLADVPEAEAEAAARAACPAVGP